MARPIPHNNECSLFKIALIGHCLAKDRALRPRQSRLQWLLYIISLIFCHPSLADTRCDNSAATLESVEGVVEWTVTDGQWQQAARGDSFCYGDKIRVLEQRAALRLANDTVVRLRENSVVTLMPEEKGFWVELLQGAGHFLSRTPKQLTIKAAYLNAAIDGTEFVVITDDQRDRVAVFEGDVRVFNRYGEVRLGEGTETSATATTAPDPARSIRLRDAAEWILYYPPLIIQNRSDPQISALMDQELYGKALDALTRDDMSTEDATLAASLALVSGQPAAADRLIDLALQQNPQSPDAYALQALKMLTAGDDQAALSQTTTLLQTNPSNISVLLAHAYALQSQGEIEEALKINRKALDLAPENLFILARTAELELSTGNTRAARKLINRALPKARNHSRLNTLAGFIALNRFSTKEAQSYFRTAINSNDSEPLARLGLALALIQKGKLEEGRAEMEMAVLLDPGSSLLRSYLGKTYAAQDQNDWADTQYQLAKNLDPNDPTPWFYQAHLKHEENKPGEALRLITTAIEKNDNRAVYRSRMLLDSDAAARSANLVGIYRALGLDKAAQNLSAKWAHLSHMEFAAHAGLANALASSQSAGDQVARINETLIGNVLIPLHGKEFNIGSARLSMLEPNWIDPSRKGSHEHAALFTESGITADFSATLGSESTRGHEWQAQARFGDVGISGGEHLFQSDGFRNNNDFATKTTEAIARWQIKPSASIFVQTSNKEENVGDLLFNIDSIDFDETFRSDISDNLNRAGFFLQTGKSNQLLIVTDKIEREFDESFLGSAQQDIKNHNFALLGKWKPLKYRLGYREENYVTHESTTDDINPLGIDNSTSNKAFIDLHSHFSPKTELLLGSSVSSNEWLYAYSQRKEKKENFRTGVKWQPTSGLSSTLAYWTDTHSRYPRYGTLESSHIFEIRTSDYLSAFATSENSAVQINYINAKIFLSIESKKRRLSSWKYTYLISDPSKASIRDQKFDETTNEVATSYLFKDNFSIWANLRENNQENNSSIKEELIPDTIKSINADIGLTFTSRHFLRYELSTHHINQDAKYYGAEYADIHEFPSRGTVFNANINFKPPKKNISVDLRILNITNKKISVFSRRIFDPLDPLSLASPALLTLPPDRTILMGLHFNI